MNKKEFIDYIESRNLSDYNISTPSKKDIVYIVDKDDKSGSGVDFGDLLILICIYLKCTGDITLNWVELFFFIFICMGLFLVFKYLKDEKGDK